MATSFISINNVNGFWIRDSMMQVACWEIVKMIDRMHLPLDVWPNDRMREHLYNNSQGIFVGFMHSEWEDFIFDEQKKEMFLKLLQSCKDDLLKRGALIPDYELNAFQLVKETKRTWIAPLETASVNKIFDWMVDLVNDKITITAGDIIDYDF